MPDLSKRVRQIVSGEDDGWAVHYRARRMQAEGVKVTMLSVGDHDIKTDMRTIRAMADSAASGNLGYSAVAGTSALRAAIAERAMTYSSAPTGPENVIVTSGGQGAIFAAMIAVLDPGDACIVLDPYYATFDQTVRAASAQAQLVATLADSGFQPDHDAIAAAITKETKAILINTPNNPTGAVYQPERLEAIAALAAQNDLWVIADELYDSQVHDGTHVSMRSLPGMDTRTIVIGSMSKGFAMTGCRVGWAIGPEDLIARICDLANTTTYGLPGFIQDAALFALKEHAEQEAEVAARYKRRRDLALQALGNAASVGLVPPEGGMYLMLDIRPTGLDGVSFAERLLDAEQIAVMPGESFGRAAAGHVRIAMTVGDDALADAIQRIVAFADRVSRERAA